MLAVSSRQNRAINAAIKTSMMPVDVDGSHDERIKSNGLSSSTLYYEC